MIGQSNSTAGRRSPPPRTTHHFYHDADGPARVSTSVVHALADVMGVDATRAEQTLTESVHPRGLDVIFADRTTTDRPGHVGFTVDGYDVTVYSTGEIVITTPSP